MTQSEPRTIHDVRRFLREINVMSLATVDAAGKPHAANLYFASDDDLNVYFVSQPGSQHGGHVLEHPQVALTVFAPVLMWQQVRGVQIRGTCSPIDPADRDRVWNLWLDKFPQMIEIREFVLSSQFYRVAPAWVRLIDNAVHFGYKLEFTCPPTPA